MARAHDPVPVRLGASGCQVWAQSVRGRVRPENQDAWCVLTPQGVGWGPDGSPSAPAAGSALSGADLVVGVFDGLGGHPNGRDAARCAAQALPGAVAADPSRPGLVARLDEQVRQTGGATTAVIAFITAKGPGEEGRLRVVSIGDSSAYGLSHEGRLRRWNPLDRSSRHELSDCLGAGEGVGHEVKGALGAGVVLVSDGVDGFVPFETEGAVLLQEDAAGTPEAMARLFQKVDDAGAPDNATVVVVRA